MIFCIAFYVCKKAADYQSHRLEKRRQAMLEMPQMIQTWKEVCLSFVWLTLLLTYMLERSWSWLEEVAEIVWELVEVQFRRKNRAV